MPTTVITTEDGAFSKLKVADIFMGGGTTIVEGTRLGMDMYGTDLNPVAWFVVKNAAFRCEERGRSRHSSAKSKPRSAPKSCRSTPAIAHADTRERGRRISTGETMAD